MNLPTYQELTFIRKSGNNCPKCALWKNKCMKPYIRHPSGYLQCVFPSVYFVALSDREGKAGGQRMKPIAQAVTTATFYEDDFWLLGLPEDLHDARRNNKFYENRVEFRDALTMDRCVEVAEGKRLIIAKAKAAFQDNNGFKGSK